MRVRHPEQDSGFVDVNGNLVPIKDSRFDAPREWVERWATINGYDVDEEVATVEAQTGVTSGTSSSEGTGSDEPTCAGQTAAGDPCTRTVDKAGSYCYQHED